MLRTWTYLWIAISFLLSYEYFALNSNPGMSLLAFLQNHGMISKALQLNPEPGRTISLWLGWSGFGLMVLTNLYILRKRVSALSGLGKLRNWLDFHIFCGLVGPTFILFHCNFKVGGLVGISFWSMVISFSSGIVGRYFYVNLLEKKRDYLSRAQRYWEKFGRRLTAAGIPVDSQEALTTRQLALDYVGYCAPNSNVLVVLGRSLIGDLKCIISPPQTLPNMSEDSAQILEAFAINERKASNSNAFQKLMGYWHTFHTPFAVFMYVVAVIHIISALFFGV